MVGSLLIVPLSSESKQGLPKVPEPACVGERVRKGRGQLEAKLAGSSSPSDEGSGTESQGPLPGEERSPHRGSSLESGPLLEITPWGLSADPYRHWGLGYHFYVQGLLSSAELKGIWKTPPPGLSELLPPTPGMVTEAKARTLDSNLWSRAVKSVVSGAR